MTCPSVRGVKEGSSFLGFLKMCYTCFTYNLQKSLFFPEICGSSSSSEREAQDLIRKLLTNAKARLAYVGIQGHPFFSLTDWDHLLNGVYACMRCYVYYSTHRVMVGSQYDTSRVFSRF